MTNRYKSFDTLKGICIITVVLCHTVHFEMIYPSILSRWLQVIFLNCFYFTAGWIYSSQSFRNRERTLREIIMSKIIQLGAPYIILSCFSLVWDAILTYGFDNRYISDTYAGNELVLRDLFCLFSLNGIGTLWFLPILLIAIVVLILADRYIKGKKRFVLAIFISLSSYIFYLWLCNVSIVPSNMISNLLAKEMVFVRRLFISISYMFLGYFFYGFTNNYMQSWVKKMTLGGVLLVLWVVDYYGHGTFPFLAVVGTPIFLLAIEEKKESLYRCRFLEYCGRNSLLIMVLHYNLLLPMVMQIFYSIDELRTLTNYMQGIILFVVDFVLTFLLMRLVEKYDAFAFLFGKGTKFKKFTKNLISRFEKRGKIHDCK